MGGRDAAALVVGGGEVGGAMREGGRQRDDGKRLGLSPEREEEG